MEAVFEEGVATRSLADFWKFLALRLLCALYMHDGISFVRNFAKLPNGWVPPADVSLKILELIQDDPSLDLTLEATVLTDLFVRSGPPDRPEVFPIRHRLAHLLFAKGLSNQGIAALVSLAKDFPRHPIARVEASVFAMVTGAKKPCEKPLREAVQLRYATVYPKLSLDDFSYYLGFAWFLLGEVESARIKFSESGFQETEGYAFVVRRLKRAFEDRSRRH